MQAMNLAQAPTLGTGAAIALTLAAATHAVAYTKAIPIPLPDGTYNASCIGDGGLEYIAISGKSMTVGWEDRKGQGLSEYRCQIRTRTRLKASKALPRSEVFELLCTSDANEETEDVLYVQSWRMRDSEASATSEGDVSAVFLHFSYPTDKEYTIHQTHLAKCTGR